MIVLKSPAVDEIAGVRKIYLADFVLNEQNFFDYALDHYDTSGYFSVDEFQDILKRVKYVKRQLIKYRSTGELKERLVLNHMIILANHFGIQPTVKMLFFRCGKELHSSLKTFLLFLNYMPRQIIGASPRPIYDTDIPVDKCVANCLRNVKCQAE